MADDTPQELAFPDYVAAIATDNLGAATITYEPSSITVDSSDIGKIFIITANATDSDENWQACRFMINVEGERYPAPHTHADVSLKDSLLHSVGKGGGGL